jgi:hypothetical protein
MKLVKRIDVDVRGRGEDSPVKVEATINEALTDLQTDANGKRNGIVVENIKEITKDSGVMSILITYEDKSIDVI